jgi:DNA replicative helicase MCM subunit Mcm2 (Cdc46/Mcm family)
LQEKGRVPKVLDVELADDLVNMCMPGDDITLTGIIKVINFLNYIKLIVFVLHRKIYIFIFVYVYVCMYIDYLITQ